MMEQCKPENDGARSQQETWSQLSGKSEADAKKLWRNADAGDGESSKLM